MKPLRSIHFVLSLIPLIWFAFFAVQVSLGAFMLGEIPVYGNPHDPNSLGLGYVSLPAAILAFLGAITVLPWIAITIITWNSSENASPKQGIILYAIGMVAFFISRFYFTDVFLWAVD